MIAYVKQWTVYYSSIEMGNVVSPISFGINISTTVMIDTSVIYYGNKLLVSSLQPILLNMFKLLWSLHRFKLIWVYFIS